MLELPETEQNLIKDISLVARKTIVVLVGGSAIAGGKWAGYADAILMSWYGGMEQGRAVSDILFGKFNPSGKLPLSFPDSTEQLFESGSGNREIFYDYYSDYRYFDKYEKKPWLAFGHGLSYTTFKYSNLNLEKEKYTQDEDIVFSLMITNTGKRKGSETVQIYVGFKNSSISPRAQKELKAFFPVELLPGQIKKIVFSIPARDLSYYSTERKAWVVEKMEYELMAGSSSAAIHLARPFKIVQ